jgi:hypothetical protein
MQDEWALFEFGLQYLANWLNNLWDHHIPLQYNYPTILGRRRAQTIILDPRFLALPKTTFILMFLHFVNLHLFCAFKKETKCKMYDL